MRSLQSKNSNISESINTYTQHDYEFDTNFFSQNLNTFECLSFISDGQKILPPTKLKMLPYFKKFIFTFFILLIILLVYSNNVFAADPKLISKLDSAFQKIEDWLIKLATPAAAVAVGTGIFMKKFSFGDEERIRTGKKIIRSSLFSYAFILAIDLILSAIKSLI